MPSEAALASNYGPAMDEQRQMISELEAFDACVKGCVADTTYLESYNRLRQILERAAAHQGAASLAGDLSEESLFRLYVSITIWPICRPVLQAALDGRLGRFDSPAPPGF